MSRDKQSRLAEVKEHKMRQYRIMEERDEQYTVNDDMLYSFRGEERDGRLPHEVIMTMLLIKLRRIKEKDPHDPDIDLDNFNDSLDDATNYIELFRLAWEEARENRDSVLLPRPEIIATGTDFTICIEDWDKDEGQGRDEDE